jgi:purine-binding chemotaxis protein CheW
MSSSATPQNSLAGKYLTVALASESYGLTVTRVREIIRVPKITVVPQLPACVRGVINLRGRVLPVIDLRTRFGLEATISPQTCIVVVHSTTSSGQPMLLGVVVDGVEEVVNIAAKDIEPPPDFGAQVHVDFLLGVAKVNGAMKSLIDLDRLFGTSLDAVAA